MTVFTIDGLLAALRGLPPEFRKLPVRAVLKVEFVNQGPLEGCYAMEHVAVCGLACANEGLFLFVDQTDDARDRSVLPALPPHFETGNPEVDGMRREQAEGDDNSGEEWKKG